MSRYFFNMVDGISISDPEGREFAGDLDGLRVEAIKDARQLISDAARSGSDISDRRFEICDEQGRLVLIVNFTEALDPEPQRPAVAAVHRR
ncbi:DUF6894 family protein [Devosia sp.]|uniref:DUF6894 family protein n=1 Tax=Devosia sp. TaxID=1871048 RepID=UPI0032641798